MCVCGGTWDLCWKVNGTPLLPSLFLPVFSPLFKFVFLVSPWEYVSVVKIRSFYLHAQ